MTFQMITRTPTARPTLHGILGRSRRCTMIVDVTTFFLLLQLGSVIAGETESRYQTVVRHLLSDSQQKRKHAEGQIIEERKTIAVIRHEKNRLQRPDSVRRAIRLLGEMRAAEGVDVLAEHIGFPYLAPFGTPMGGAGGHQFVDKSPEELFPAIDALLEIGEPSVDPILEKIAKTDSGVELNAYVAVLRGLEKRKNVRDRLARMTENAPPCRQKRLRKAVEWLHDPPKSAFP